MKLDAHFSKPIVVKMLHSWCCQDNRIKTKLEAEAP